MSVPIMQGQRWADRKTHDICCVDRVEVIYMPDKAGSSSMKLAQRAGVWWGLRKPRSMLEQFDEYALRRRCYRAYMSRDKTCYRLSGTQMESESNGRQYRFLAPNSEDEFLVYESDLRAHFSNFDCWELTRLRRRMR